MDPTATPQFSLAGQALLDHIAERAAQMAKAEVLAREERRNRTLTTVIAVLGLAGVGAVMGGLKLLVWQEMHSVETRMAELRDELDAAVGARFADQTIQTVNHVREQVLADVAKELGDVRRQLQVNSQFEEYAELADRVAERLSGVHRGQDKYVAAVLGETMQAIRAVAAEPELTGRTRFLVVTRRIVEVLVRFNRVAEIDEIDDLLGDFIRRDAELAKALADHYGQLVVGSPLPLPEQVRHVERLERYATAAGHTVYAHKQLVWRLFLEFKRNGFQRTAATDGLLESSQDLTPESREQFWFDLCLYSDPSLWMIAVDQQGRELKRLMAALVERYPIVANMIEQVVEANPAIQQNIAERRMRTRSIMATHGQPAEDQPQSPPQTPAKTAAATGAQRR
ncbi:MAG: hypothetical protein KF688_04420 [Pirellulales bacterium]|nr:hypothetical protein [Pirellulales bacterium]